MEKEQLVLKALTDLKNIISSASEYEIENIKKKYGILILGYELNYISSTDIASFVQSAYNATIDISTVNDIIPDICTNLNMEFEALGTIKHAGSDTVDGYLIKLY